MPLADFVVKNRKEILALARKHGVRKVRVFGSAARGEPGSQSDLDLLVEAGETTTPWFPGGLIADLEELLGRKVDVAEPDTIHWVIREKVLQEAVLL